MQLVILSDGQVRCLYSEAIELDQLGRLHISRGSHVEPDSDGHWFAELAPVDRPKLGPFVRRSQALAAEQTWLEAHWLLGESPLATERFSDDNTIPNHSQERA